MPLGHIESWSQWLNAHRYKVKRASITNDVQALTEYCMVPMLVTSKNVIYSETTNHSATHDFRVNGRLITGTVGGDDWDAEDTVTFRNNSHAATCRLSLQSSPGAGMSDLELTAGDEERIFNLFYQRQEEQKLELIDKIERGLCSIPTSGAANEGVRGFPYHITYNSTTGHTGGNPNGHSTWQSVDLSAADMDGLKNYSDTYAEFTADDLFKKLDRAMDDTNFKSPIVSQQALPYSELSQRSLATTKYVMTELKAASRLQNENLGLELTFPASGDGLMVRGRPIMAVPALTPTINDRQTVASGLPLNPIYILDASAIKILIHKDFWFRQTIRDVAKKHLQSALYLDCLIQTQCMRKRTLGVLATGAPA